jgi:methyl-accepting chemotaxis protein
MIELLRRLTILKRLFIMLILAAIGTVVFGSFSVKEQYNHLIEQKSKQITVQVDQLSSTLDAFQLDTPDVTAERLRLLVSNIKITDDQAFIIVDNQNRIIIKPPFSR